MKTASSILRSALAGVGLQVRRVNRPPYDHLRAATRYVEQVVDVMGQPLHIADAMSFYWNYQDIFVNDIYRFTTSRSRPYVIDCSANCGLGVVYFKYLFPQAEVVAVEPDPAIFRLLRTNVRLRRLEQVTLLERAIGSSGGVTPFFCEGADGGRCHPLSGARERIEVQTIALDDLIDRPVDFLKMDIEGSETDAILNSKKLGLVEQLFIEYHAFEDTEQTLGGLLEALRAQDFRYYIHTQFCSRRPFVERRVQLGMDLQLNIFGRRTGRAPGAAGVTGAATR